MIFITIQRAIIEKWKHRSGKNVLLSANLVVWRLLIKVRDKMSYRKSVKFIHEIQKRLYELWIWPQRQNKIHRTLHVVIAVVSHGRLELKVNTINRLEALELWISRRILKVPWTAKKTKEEILRKIGRESELQNTGKQRIWYKWYEMKDTICSKY